MVNEYKDQLSVQLHLAQASTNGAFIDAKAKAAKWTPRPCPPKRQLSKGVEYTEVAQ